MNGVPYVQGDTALGGVRLWMMLAVEAIGKLQDLA